jgi:hypothetical protein
VFPSEQIEYYAQKLHRTNVLTHPSLAVRDAAYRLMERDDGALAFTDENNNGYKVVDVASKVLGYDASYRVATQFVQSGCGCGGSASQGLKQAFTYVTYTWTGGISGKSTCLNETLYDGGAYDTPYRTTYYDFEDVRGAGVPYLMNEVTSSPDGRNWVWSYKYAPGGDLTYKYTPAAMSPVYTPATQDHQPTTGYNQHGLVYVYTYTSGTGEYDHLLLTMSTQDGDTGTPQLVSRITYGDSSVGKPYLPIKMERFAVAGTSDENQIETTWIRYGFRAPQAPDAIAFRHIFVEA